MVVKKESSAQLATWLEIEMEKVVKKRRRTDEVLLRSKLSKVSVDGKGEPHFTGV